MVPHWQEEGPLTLISSQVTISQIHVFILGEEGERAPTDAGKICKLHIEKPPAPVGPEPSGFP